MPKIVDHVKQKEKVAEAAWRVIRREGFEGASVRKIAEEAGISAGSMRHYFSTQSDLMVYSMSLVSERVQLRIQSIEFTGNPFEDSQKVLFELLPLNQEKSAEMEVWILYYLKARTDTRLYSLGEKVYEEMRTGISLIIDGLIRMGVAKENLDREVEIERLFALIDGLAIHGIIQPGKLSVEMMKNTVIQHLKSISKD